MTSAYFCSKHRLDLPGRTFLGAASERPISAYRYTVFGCRVKPFSAFRRVAWYMELTFRSLDQCE
jgi:hypothetical protein